MELRINRTPLDNAKDGQQIPPIIDTSIIGNRFLDLRYDSISETTKLDLYLPESESGRFPLIIHIHGGAFMLGDKRDIQLQPWLEAIDRGYALASINYRMSREALFPAAVEDCKNAVRFLRANADLYRIDPDRIAIVGGSAGGNLAAMVAVTAGHSGFKESSPINDASCAVQACVDWFGPTDFLKMDEQLASSGLGPCDHDQPDSPESRYLGGHIVKLDPNYVQSANPMTYVHPEIPPFLIQHGDRDHVVPCQQSLIFVEKIVSVAGKDRVKFEILSGADHADPMFITPENMSKNFQFLDQILKIERNR